MILVTGSTGFIGSQLCQALAAQGERVRAFHRPGSSLAALNGVDVELAVGDITRPETLAAAMRGVEVVFHAAAKVGRHSTGSMDNVTVQGTRNVLQAAQEAGVRRVVHTSSVAALGVPLEAPRGAAAPQLMDETHTWNYPHEAWPYGFAKYRAELQVQQAVARGLDAVIVNPAVVIGAGDLNRISGDVIERVAHGQVPVATSGGLNVVHIQDVVQGHLAALECGCTGERYILGGENLSIPTFLQLAADVTGAASPRIQVPAVLAHAAATSIQLLGNRLPLPVGGEMLRLAGFYFYYDTLKARLQLGLKDPLPARTAVEEAWAWFQANPKSKN
jgi:dihydroflavonol-4-reductase